MVAYKVLELHPGNFHFAMSHYWRGDYCCAIAVINVNSFTVTQSGHHSKQVCCGGGFARCVLMKRKRLRSPSSFLNVCWLLIVFTINNLHRHQKLVVEATSSLNWAVTVHAVSMWYLCSHRSPICSNISEKEHVSYPLMQNNKSSFTVWLHRLIRARSDEPTRNYQRFCRSPWLYRAL